MNPPAHWFNILSDTMKTIVVFLTEAKSQLQPPEGQWESKLNCDIRYCSIKLRIKMWWSFTYSDVQTTAIFGANIPYDV